MLLAALDDARIVTWAQLLAPFSMYPLLKKDGLMLAYLGTVAFYWAATVLAPAGAVGLLEATTEQAQPTARPAKRTPGGSRSGTGSTGSSPAAAAFAEPLAAVEAVAQHGPTVSLVVAAVLQLAAELVPPPERYPFLFDAAITAWAFLHFALLFVYTNAQQWLEYKRSAPSKPKQL